MRKKKSSSKYIYKKNITLVIGTEHFKTKYSTRKAIYYQPFRYVRHKIVKINSSIIMEIVASLRLTPQNM